MARRKLVYVHFQKIEMKDDSDDLSDGEFKFYFFLNNQLVKGNYVDIKLPNEETVTVQPTHLSRTMGSGQKRNIDWLGLAEKVDQVTIAVSGLEDDDDPDILPSFDPHGTQTPKKPLGTGSNSWAEWVTGSLTVQTPDPPTDKAVRTPFTLNANGHKHGVDVWFKVFGEVIVTFG